MAPLPSVRIPHPHVIIDDDGSPLVAGSRVPVRRLFAWHRQGTTVETLLRRYPQLGPSRILDALSFAYDNLELVTQDSNASAIFWSANKKPPPSLPRPRKSWGPRPKRDRRTFRSNRSPGTIR